MRKRRVGGASGRAVLGALLVLTVAGCSPQGEPGHGPAHTAEVPDVRPLSGATAFTHAQAVRLFNREERAVADCMTGRGMRYDVRPRGASARGEETNPYGLLSPRRAATDGYGMVGEYLHLREHPPPADEPRKKAWQQALTGTPAHRRTVELPDGSRAEFSTDGCVTAASNRVYGKDWDVLEVTTSGLASRVLTAVEKDPGHRSAIRRWAACMSAKGYDGYTADGLQAPRKQLNARLEGAVGDPATLRELAQDELRTAKADAGCQVRTKLGVALRRVQGAVEPTVLTARDRSTVDRYTTLKRQALSALAATDPP